MIFGTIIRRRKAGIAGADPVVVESYPRADLHFGHVAGNAILARRDGTIRRLILTGAVADHATAIELLPLARRVFVRIMAGCALHPSGGLAKAGALHQADRLETREARIVNADFCLMQTVGMAMTLATNSNLLFSRRRTCA